jgi:organic radical activating enzyme
MTTCLEPAATRPRHRADLNVLIGRKCNAACEHCSISSSPDNEQRMAPATVAAVLRALDHFAVWSPGGRVILTGGEPLLYRRDLIDIGTRARGLGLRLGIETNGYWAKTSAIAERTLDRYRITDMILSSSRFHAAYVAPERVGTAYRAAKAGGIEVQIRVSQLEADEALDPLLARLGDGIDPADLVVEAVLPFGRGRSIADDAPPGDGDDPLLCPSDGPMIMDDGRIDPCCGPLTALPDHALTMGLIDAAPVDPFARIEADPVFSLIRERGLRALSARLAARGIDASEPLRCGDACTACARLMTDPRLAPAIQALRADPAAGD